MKLGRKTLNKKAISVLIKNAQVIAFLKFCYRQLFGKSGWLGRSACTDFLDFFGFFLIKVAYPKVLPCKKSKGLLKAFSSYLIFKIDP